MLHDEMKIQNGRVVSIKNEITRLVFMKDELFRLNIDLLKMYQQKLEDAIDECDREEMKRWSRELFNALTTDTNTELPIGKHDDIPDSAFIESELSAGVKHEMEHTNDIRVAKSIAKDHLAEIPNYYSLLEKMESAAKDKEK